MAYHNARYIDQVVITCGQEYDIPLYTNVWQNYFGNDKDPAAPSAGMIIHLDDAMF